MAHFHRTGGSNSPRLFNRLLVPHFFWAFVYFAIYKLLFLLNVSVQDVGIRELIIQLLTGHSYNKTEWFQIELIVLTLFYILVFRVLPKQGVLGFTLLTGYLSLLLQYSGVNGALFENVLTCECFKHEYVMVLIGRFFEMIPYASLGIVLCNYKVLSKLKEKWKYTIIITTMILFLLLKYPAFVEIERQYSYSGIGYIAFSVLSILLFCCVPLDWLPTLMKTIIRFISRYTMAIYYMHRLIGTLLYNTPMKIWIRLSLNFHRISD